MDHKSTISIYINYFYINHILNDFILVIVSHDILDIHITLSSIMDAIWMKTYNKKMISSFVLPHHYLLIKCIINIWLQVFYIGFEITFYDYSQLCSHLGHLVIDFLVVKDKIPFSETFDFDNY